MSEMRRAARERECEHTHGVSRGERSEAGKAEAEHGKSFGCGKRCVYKMTLRKRRVAT